jgi:hypothetical protein
MSDTGPLLPAGHPARATPAPSIAPTPIDAVIDAIIARLKDVIAPSVVIDWCPEKAEEYELGTYHAAVLVMPGDIQYDTSKARQTVEIVAYCLTRALRPARSDVDGDTIAGPHAARLVEDVRLALHGNSFAGSTAVIPLRVTFDGLEAGVAQYRSRFQASLPLPIAATSRIAAPVRILGGPS